MKSSNAIRPLSGATAPLTMVRIQGSVELRGESFGFDLFKKLLLNLNCLKH